jgi:hypothetical protein
LRSSVSTVIRRFDFKTFNSPPPVQKGRSVTSAAVEPPAPTGARSVQGWGIFKWPQAGDFGWPPGPRTKRPSWSPHSSTVIRPLPWRRHTVARSVRLRPAFRNWV